MKVFKNIVIWLLTLCAIASLCVFLFINFCCGKVVVDGTSMNPTLQTGELGLFIKKDTIFSNIKRNDIVIFDGELSDESELLIKRVVGLPGDHVKISLDGSILVNDQELDQSYISQEQILATYQLVNLRNMDVTLQDDEYFVLGDNRLVSFDSRIFGPIKEGQLKGEFKLSYGRFKNYDSSTNEGSDKSYFPLKWFTEVLWNL